MAFRFERYSYIDTLKAVELKLTALHILLINLFVHNLIWRGMRPLDKEPMNYMWRFDLNKIARAFSFLPQRLYMAINALCRIRITASGNKIQIVTKQIVGQDLYIGISWDIIYFLIKDAYWVFVHQCREAGRLDLLELYETRLKVEVEEKGEKVTGLLEDMRTPEVLKKDKKVKASGWAYKLIKKICRAAEKRETPLLIEKGGRNYKVFAHLVDGEFRARHKEIDRAAVFLDDLCSGYFFRGRREYFTGIEDMADRMRGPDALEDFQELQGDKEAVAEFIMTCTHNYLDKLDHDIRNGGQILAYPHTVKEFICNEHDDICILNFLLYYHKPRTKIGLAIDAAQDKVYRIVDPGVFDRLCGYANNYINKGGECLSFWKFAFKTMEAVNEGDRYGAYIIQAYSIFFKIFDAMDRKIARRGFSFWDISLTSHCVTNVLERVRCREC
jgi:hypothetical protein